MQALKSFVGFKQVGVAVALAASAFVSAQAAPIFTVAPSFLGGGANFVADFIVGGSTTLVTRSNIDPNVASGSGYISFSSFQLNAVDVLGNGLNASYQLWIEYSYTNVLTGGTWGTSGSTYDLTGLSFNLYGSAGLTTTFVGANFTGGTANAPTVTAGSNAKILLGSGGLISGISAINAQGGAALNSFTTYSNQPAGDSFFVAPTPFFNLAFNNFNNTFQGVNRRTIGGVEYIALTNQNGGVDFQQPTLVPTPGTLALVGLGLASLGFAARRKTKI